MSETKVEEKIMNQNLNYVNGYCYQICILKICSYEYRLLDLY